MLMHIGTREGRINSNMWGTDEGVRWQTIIFSESLYLYEVRYIECNIVYICIVIMGIMYCSSVKNWICETLDLPWSLLWFLFSYIDFKFGILFSMLDITFQWILYLVGLSVFDWLERLWYQIQYSVHKNWVWKYSRTSTHVVGITPVQFTWYIVNT